MKKYIDRLLLAVVMKQKFPIYFAKIERFFIFETKSSLSTSVFIFSTIPKIFKTKFYVHVETENQIIMPNYYYCA